MLKVLGLAVSLVLGAAACNGILGNTEASGTNDHLFDPSGSDASSEAGAAGDAGGTSDAGANDAARESAVADATPDTGLDAATLNCGAPALVNSCLDCPGKILRCGTNCVANCVDGCGGVTGSPVECIACNAAGVPDVATCESGLTPGGCQSGHQRCPCTGGVAECPGDNQVCNSGACVGCGEAMTDGVDCKGAGTCDNKFNSLRYTCH